MASLLCNARECASGGEVRGRALGHPDLRRGKSGPWVEFTLPHLGASLLHHGDWDRAWQHRGWVGRVDGELPSATLVAKRVWGPSLLHPRSRDHVGSQGREGAR